MGVEWKGNCVICKEELAQGRIGPKQVQPAEGNCFVCRRAVCVGHSVLDVDTGIRVCFEDNKPKPLTSQPRAPKKLF